MEDQVALSVVRVVALPMGVSVLIRGNEDAFRRGKIIAVGQVWESVLQQYWLDPSLSVNMIAKRLGVDPMTVKRHAQRIGLNMCESTGRKHWSLLPRKCLTQNILKT